MRGAYNLLETYLPGLQKKVLLPGVGHNGGEEIEVGDEPERH